MLPVENEAELAKVVKFIVDRWQLEHTLASAIMQAKCLGFQITRADFLHVVRTYCDLASENKSIGTCRDKLSED